MDIGRKRHRVSVSFSSILENAQDEQQFFLNKVEHDTDWYNQDTIPNFNICRSVEDQKVLVKQQAQWLLLLRHSRKCIYKDEGGCPKSPRCWIMQKVWKHLMTKCTVIECTVPHCATSILVMKHYLRCLEDACGVCGPVREAISKSHLKRNKDLQKAADGLRSLCDLCTNDDSSTFV
jgi:hypothetical protein